MVMRLRLRLIERRHRRRQIIRRQLHLAGQQRRLDPPHLVAFQLGMLDRAARQRARLGELAARQRHHPRRTTRRRLRANLVRPPASLFGKLDGLLC